MSLEQKNKPELVKLARELDQENKVLKQELAQVKEELDNAAKSEEDKERSDLPYSIASPIQIGKHRSIMVVVKFDEDGNCEVEENEKLGSLEHYKIQFHVSKYNEEKAFKFNRRKEKSNGKD